MAGTKPESSTQIEEISLHSKREQTRTVVETDYLVSRESIRKPNLSIVLPTLNEEEGIVECIRRIAVGLELLDIRGEIIVSDSSTDKTAEIAENHGATIVTPNERGYGAAYKEGLRITRGDYVVMGDADTTYDFTAIPTLLTPLLSDQADLVLGSRYKGEIKDGAMPKLHQYIGNPVLTAVLNKLFDGEITDAHTGFRAIRRESLNQLDLYSDGMEFASEMIIEAMEKELRIEEVPIVYDERSGEATLHSFRDGWRHLRFMLSYAANRRDWNGRRKL